MKKFQKVLNIIFRIFDLLLKIIDRFGTLNLILVGVIIMAVNFNSQIIELYEKTGSIPETYAITVILALIGECGICGMITRAKVKSLYGIEIIDEPEKSNPIGFSAPSEETETETEEERPDESGDDEDCGGCEDE